MNYKERFKELLKDVECHLEDYVDSNSLRDDDRQYSKEEAETIATISASFAILNGEHLLEAFENLDTYLEEK